MAAYIDKLSLYQSIESIRSQFGFSFPLCPYQIVENLRDVDLISHRFDSDKAAGVLLRGEKSIIILNSKRGIRSQRFTLTHELVHYFMHGSVMHFMCDTVSKSPLEWQANEGAAELLMPYRYFLQDIKNISSFHGISSLKMVFALAEKYQVSTAMIRNRIESLTYEINQYMRGVKMEDIVITSRKKIPIEYNKNDFILNTMCKSKNIDAYFE